MEQQGERMSVISTEGGFLYDFGNGYKKTEDVSFVLKAHDGDQSDFHRMSGRSNVLEKPALSIVLTTQPRVIEKFIKNEEFREKGLVARFLITNHDESMLGTYNVEDKDIPEEITQKYKNLILKMLERETPTLPYALILSTEAYLEYLKYVKHTANKRPNEWYNMRDFGGKSAGTMLRIAGLLHCAITDIPEIEEISVDTIKNAIEIMNCLCKHIEKAYEIHGLNKTSNEAKYVLERIKSLDKNELTQRELFQSSHGRFKTIEELKKPLETLKNKNYIKIFDVVTGGRPSTKLILNPSIYRCKSCKSPHLEEENIKNDPFEPFATKKEGFENANFNCNSGVI